MGYTHYYAYRPTAKAYRDAFPRIVEDTRRIVQAVTTQGIPLTGDGRTPTLTSEKILINGSRRLGDDFDLFYLSSLPPSLLDDGPDVVENYHRRGGVVRAFCKTRRKPYDLAVATVLLRARLLLPARFLIDSDGAWNDEWRAARALLTRLFTSPTVPDATPFSARAGEADDPQPAA